MNFRRMATEIISTGHFRRSTFPTFPTFPDRTGLGQRAPFRHRRQLLDMARGRPSPDTSFLASAIGAVSAPNLVIRTRDFRPISPWWPLVIIVAAFIVAPQ